VVEAGRTKLLSAPRTPKVLQANGNNDEEQRPQTFERKAQREVAAKVGSEANKSDDDRNLSDERNDEWVPELPVTFPFLLVVAH
jgi:hypothetical protein